MMTDELQVEPYRHTPDRVIKLQNHEEANPQKQPALCVFDL